MVEPMYILPKIGRLHIELSSRCNASCPACSRNLAGGPVAPDLELTELTLEDIQFMFPDEILENIVGINFCGNVGDPGTAKDLLPILEHFQSKSKQKLAQQIRTNGGMRNADFWHKIGEFFAKQPPAKDDHLFSQAGVVFSVDGLEDTNHIYRRGVKWEKLFANMKAYSEAGATGIWEWLVFEHNQHQLEEAEKLAKSLGFIFTVKNPMGFGEYEGVLKGLPVYDKDGNYEYSIYPKDYNGDKTEDQAKVNTKIDLFTTNSTLPQLNDFSRTLAKSSTVDCKSINGYHQEVYISATGHLLPCCFLGGIFGQFTTSYSRYQFNTKLAEFGVDNLNLRKHNLIEVLNNPEFSKFFRNGWDAKTVEDGKLLFCTETCGEISAIDRLYDRKIIPIVEV